MNNQLMMLLAQLMQAQQNPLQQLLSQQNQQQDVLSQLLGGNNQNSLNTLLGGVQQPQIDSNLLALLAQQSQGGQQQAPQLDAQTIQALQALLASQGGEAGNKDGDILSKLKEKNDTSEIDELRDAMKFNLEFSKFIEDYEDLFPTWFDPKEAVEEVDKWAKTDGERAQALAGATVKAFFKDGSALDLLEPRDRKFVEESILAPNTRTSDIDRKMAWPMLQRAIHNRHTQGNSQPTGGKDVEAGINAFTERFSPNGGHTHQVEEE
ncbi:hypothetical protein [Vibrio harveyi]|uniref:hypothetical protein n=1 Tax=Vibrio harveyi TaxID=669 RepID=UPI003CF21D6D